MILMIVDFLNTTESLYVHSAHVQLLEWEFAFRSLDKILL